jgi:heme O synthase-like polyprenyltransferase
MMGLCLSFIISCYIPVHFNMLYCGTVQSDYNDGMVAFDAGVLLVFGFAFSFVYTTLYKFATGKEYFDAVSEEEIAKAYLDASRNPNISFDRSDQFR